MANTIDTAFVTQFEAEIKLAYQRMGAKLPNTVRRKTVTGSSTTFQKLASGEAQSKGRNSQVPILNLAHTNVSCTMADSYAGEFADRLDVLKVQHDERQALATSIAAAMGRKTDSNIITAVDGTSNDTGDTGGVTKAKVETIYEAFGNNDVPDDGERYLWVSPQGWTDLMGVTEFSDRDYVPESQLPFPGLRAKEWFSFKIGQHSGLTKVSTVRQSLAYHRSAVGFGVNAEVNVDITWQGKEQSWLIVGSLSNGACIIDDNGVYRLDHTET
jgi:hypothetical protein